jgi:MmpS family membrane protein
MAFAGVLKRVWNSTVTDAVVSPRAVVYEVFRPVGTVADISYFDLNSDPHRVGRARLPWSLQITANVRPSWVTLRHRATATALAAGWW